MIKEFLRKMNQVAKAMPDAGKIQLLRMKVADVIGFSITSAVIEGKNYKGIYKMLTQLVLDTKKKVRKSKKI